MIVTTLAGTADDQFDVAAAMTEEAAQLESVVMALRWDDPDSAIAADLAATAAKLREAADQQPKETAVMPSKWTRDAGGWYISDTYPSLLIRPSNSPGVYRWEVVRFRKPASYEVMAVFATLKDAKATVQREGARWSA